MRGSVRGERERVASRVLPRPRAVSLKGSDSRVEVTRGYHARTNKVDVIFLYVFTLSNFCYAYKINQLFTRPAFARTTH